MGITDDHVVNLISIGTPVNKYDFSFLLACRKPLLFVHGDQDEFGNLSELEQLVSKLKENSPVELKTILGAGHFFTGHLDELKQAITTWIEKQLVSRAG